MFDSVTFVAMNSALDGLSMRQRVIADNIANIQTPGFLAGRVSFEASLAAAVADGSGAVTATVGRSLEPTREDGNNVNLDTETLLEHRHQPALPAGHPGDRRPVQQASAPRCGPPDDHLRRDRRRRAAG